MEVIQRKPGLLRRTVASGTVAVFPPQRTKRPHYDINLQRRSSHAWLSREHSPLLRGCIDSAVPVRANDLMNTT
jgi:hypothetical protein